MSRSEESPDLFPKPTANEVRLALMARGFSITASDDAGHAYSRGLAATGLLVVFDAAKRLLETASIARGAPQALVEGNFAHHADQIAAGWRDLKEAVAKMEAGHAEAAG